MRTTSLLLALVLSLASCGSADPASLNGEGYAALGSGKHAEAAARFQAALDALGANTSDTEYERAMMGLIEANVHVDPDAAQEDFLALASSGAVDASDYSRIGGMLASAHKYPQAIRVIDAGVQANPETPDLIRLLERIKADAEKTGDTDALKQLESLGYL